MLLPLRAKNPPESYPYVTIGLIAANILVYLATADYVHQLGFVVRPECVNALAVSGRDFSIWRLFTSLFLHENILHIAGNMWFLWLFGSSVEGRLGSLRYAVVYLLCGIGGGLLHEFVVAVHEPTIPSLGASGAIMGIAACYLYMFPYSKIYVFRWFFIAWIGVVDWPAWGVVLFYVGLDLVSTMIGGGSEVAHFAHIGGFGVGLLCMLALRPHRDKEDYSELLAARSEVPDYRSFTFTELETLMERPHEDTTLILTYCEKGLAHPSQRAQDLAADAVRQYARLLVEEAEPALFAGVLLKLPREAVAMPPVYYLRLGSRLEQELFYELALHIYWRVCEFDPWSQDAQRALYRFGTIMETVYQDHELATRAYEQILANSREGAVAFQARQGLERLRAPAPEQAPEPEPRREMAPAPGVRANFLEFDGPQSMQGAGP